MVPDRNPRTEWGCQPVAFISSLAVTPSARLSSSNTLLVLLPSRAPVAFFAPLGAFLAGVAFLADLAVFLAIGRPVAQRVPFLVASVSQPRGLELLQFLG